MAVFALTRLEQAVRAGGLEVDLTREQFSPEEIVSAGTVVARPPAIKRLNDEYELLRGRVLAALAEG